MPSQHRAPHHSASTNTPWFALPPDAVLSSLDTPENGLDSTEAGQRLATHGPNQLAVKRGRSRLAIFLEQFKSPLILILLAAAVIAFFMEKGLDVYVILAIVFINAMLGYVLERRAAGAIAALQRLTSPRARVMRAGRVEDIPASEVVVGDILLLESGDRIAADARIIHASELAIAEAELTGESLPVPKDSRAIEAQAYLPLGDQVNMAFMSTAVVSGRGRAVVVTTGMATQVGKIASDVSEASAQTPVQRKLADFGRRLGIIIVMIIGTVLALGVALGHPFAEMFYVAISLAVAAVPEGLPIVVSVLFAIGVTRMAKRHAMIRRLPAVEGLGSATIICSDKTGTLTRNAMTVEQISMGSQILAVEGAGYEPSGRVLAGGIPAIAGQARGLHWLGACARLCNDSVLEQVDGEWRILGDPTEGALRVLSEKLQFREEWDRVDEIPFSSERKWMATLNRAPDGELVAFVKGALERLLPMASHYQASDGTILEFDEEARSGLLNAAHGMADQALRTLALGVVRAVDHAGVLSADYLHGRLVLAGLVGMIDPPRPEAIPAVLACQSAGIRVAMITGDHRATATAIARQLGILRESQIVMEAADLEKMTDDELDNVVQRAAVYARVNPSHKMRIVKALQRKGAIVAMTGDGVNDAPALSQADIGIAMGITGTEVAKGAADMVLADDNFATIVAAVEEGRAISDNLRKVAEYLTATCVGNIATVAGSIVLGLPLPLTAVMLLWINLVATGVFDKPLALEQGDPDLMNRPPRAPGDPLITRSAFVRLMCMGVGMAVGTLAVFAWELSIGTPIEHARTEAFTVNATFQAFSAFAFRSAERPLYRLPSNRWLFGAALVALLVQLLAVYWMPLQLLLGTVSLAPWEFGVAVAEGLILLLAAEIYKVVRWHLRRAEKPGA
ncbi:MAG TPA: HAD-IC family P-type ATPase [Burkholderiaceae bacterium]|nr:HAD-IC family P-type ATPase [Burkholderiaceae bacterium]